MKPGDNYPELKTLDDFNDRKDFGILISHLDLVCQPEFHQALSNAVAELYPNHMGPLRILLKHIDSAARRKLQK